MGVVVQFRWCKSGRLGASWHQCGQWKCHALPVFASVNSYYPLYGHHDVASAARKTRFEFNKVVAQFQGGGSVKADVQNDLLILDILAGDLNRVVNGHRNVRCKSVIGTPFIQSPYQVRAC